MFFGVPVFSSIIISNIPTELETLLCHHRHVIRSILAQPGPFSWDNLMRPLESLEDQLHQYWARINHLHAVTSSDALREAYNKCLGELSAYHTELGHNHDLYEAIASLVSQPLDVVQQEVVRQALRDFRLAGVALALPEKQRFAALSAELSQLTALFEENVMDATEKWSYCITDEAELAGIPSHDLTLAAERAQVVGHVGWLFNLEMPSYLAVMMYADSRALREKFYRAYCTRAPENKPVILGILSRRLEAARLLGFSNYAEYALITKMAKSPETALHFLHQLTEASLPQAKKEYDALAAFAAAVLGIGVLESWDVSYASEKLRQHQYDLSQEALCPYFSEACVMRGLFDIVHRLFGVDIKKMHDADVWHPDATAYAVYKNDVLIAYCYFDLYARPHKKSGAWMDDSAGRRRLDNGDVQKPVAFVTCNFSSPSQGYPALFTHDDVVTLFHEMGHALQHILTTVDYLSVSGINGIPWDAVELPSQFLENWAWDKQSLGLFAQHYQSGEMLPDALYEKMLKAKHFQAAMQMMRQLEMALFDMRLHVEFDPSKNNETQDQVQDIVDATRRALSVVPVPAYNRFQHSFLHLFNSDYGGYAAGYYSYKWAEVMASDAFSVFAEKGIFDRESAARFCACILEPGGSEDPVILYRRYRGRDPDMQALLRETRIA